MADIPLEDIELEEGEGAIGVFEVGRDRFYVVQISRFETIEEADGFAEDVLAGAAMAGAMTTIH